MVSIIINSEDYFDFKKENLCCVLLKANRHKTCVMLGPVFDKIATQYKNRLKFGKIDIDQFSRISEYERISAIPELIIYENGKAIFRKHCTDERDLEKFINESVKLTNKANDEY